jgi:hypothetical protein
MTVAISFSRRSDAINWLTPSTTVSNATTAAGV